MFSNNLPLCLQFVTTSTTMYCASRKLWEWQIINLFLINKFLIFRAMEFEYDIEVESTIRPILYSSRPTSLPRFCKLTISKSMYILKVYSRHYELR